jgi:hypothetical protein
MDLEKTKGKFNEHVLENVLNTPNTKIFIFGKKDENGYWRMSYRQKWIFDGGNLIITGDCFCSIYRFNSGIDIDFFKDVYLPYFSEKCVSDKDGSSQNVYDHSEAIDRMKTIAVDYGSDTLFEEQEEYKEEYESMLGIIENIENRLSGKLEVLEHKLELLEEGNEEKAEELSGIIDEYNDVINLDSVKKRRTADSIEKEIKELQQLHESSK